jgi:hypothetical protein
MTTRGRITTACLWIGIAAALLYDHPRFSAFAFAVAAMAAVVAAGATFLPARQSAGEDGPNMADMPDSVADSLDAPPDPESLWAREPVLQHHRLFVTYAIKGRRPTFAEQCVEIIERLSAGPEAGSHEFTITNDGRFIIRPIGKQLAARPAAPPQPPELIAFLASFDDDDTARFH